AVRKFVESGGSLVFTGATATLDEWGEKRDMFPLESITGIQHLDQVEGRVDHKPFNLEIYEGHNYLRLPQPADRHAVVRNFEHTDILPFGGKMHLVQADERM